MLFRYALQIVERFPAVVGGVIHATGRGGGSAPAALSAEVVAGVVAARARIGDTPLSEVPSLAAWRRAFRTFGVDPTQYRSAAEALLRRITKGADLPSINVLVDLANLVSVRYALPVAVFDLGAIAGGLTVGIAPGDEAWADLGSSTAEHPVAGEVVFTDEAGVVHARRWCWRQSATSAAGTGTAEALVTVEGHHDGASADVAHAVADLEDLLAQFASPASMRSAILSAAEPAFR